MRTYDGMLLGKSDGSGQLLRVFDPPWYRIDRWIGWYVGVAVERAAYVIRSWLGLAPKAATARGWADVGGQRVRVVDDPLVLPNVPRRR